MFAFIGALIISVVAAFVGSSVTAEAQKQSSGTAISTQEKIALKQSEQETAIIRADREKQAELTEKQMMLETQRMQISTLANLISADRAIAGVAPQQIMITPSRTVKPSAFQELNSWIDNLFSGRG